MKNKLFIVSAFLVITFSNCVLAQDWPQFLGPQRNSTSPQKNLLRTWPEKGPEVLWSVNVGIGYGGPVINGGKVYLLDRIDSIGDKMRCFELSTGKELWNYTATTPGTDSVN